MSSLPPLNMLSADYWENFRKDVFQLIAWGYQIEEQVIRSRHLEEDITGLIRQGIDKKFITDLPPRFIYYTARNEDPVDAENVYGNDRSVIDIAIVRRGVGIHIRYCLEAKRCERSNNKIGWYSQGITSYVERKYSADCPEAGMLGLVQSNDALYWKRMLAKKLARDASLLCESPLVLVDVTPDIEHIHASNHRRTDGSSILLIHAFLDCKAADMPEFESGDEDPEF